MQVYANSNRVSKNTLLFFLFTLFLAFLPVSTFLFFLKNDTFNGYFPPKFFMSESIHAGYLPLWNPYINFGIPQYGDMSSGFWSPITWLIASTAGYNAYSLTLEVLFYILLGGIGMYKVTGLLQLNKTIRLIAGIAFMCCGYTVGHLQHFNWLSGAAFLPWCFWSYLKLLKSFSVKNCFISVISFYMFISSAHPGIIISGFYFFVALLIFYFFTTETTLPLKTKIRALGKVHVFFIVTLLVLSAGIISGYLDILPYFARGEKISLENSLSAPVNLQSWVSSLLPFATVKNNAFYNTDVSMRNTYFSVLLLIFFISSLFNKKNSWQKFFLITGIVFALLSSGGIFKTLAYKFVPFIGYVRLNGEFIIFTLFCFILVAAIELNNFIEQKKKLEGITLKICYTIALILLGCICFGIYNLFNTHDSMFFKLKPLFKLPSWPLKLKFFIDAISFYDTFWIQSLIQLFILSGLIWCLKSRHWNLLKWIVVTDLIVACLLNLPYTGVGKSSVMQVQAVIDKSPKGIPVPALQSLLNNDTLSVDEKGLVGDWSMYNKQIGVKKEVPYPVELNNMKIYFEKKASASNELYLDKPFLFTTNDTLSNIKIINFSPNGISVQVNSGSASLLVLKQNNYPHWYYSCGKEKKVLDKFGVNFMSAPLTKGSNTITLSFEPTIVKWSMLLSLVTFILLCAFIFFAKTKLYVPS